MVTKIDIESCARKLGFIKNARDLQGQVIAEGQELNNIFTALMLDTPTGWSMTLAHIRKEHGIIKPVWLIRMKPLVLMGSH